MDSHPAPVNVSVVTVNSAPSFIVRAIWYIFVGWWLGGIAITLAYLLLPWIITTPLSFWLFNRIGTAMTLRPRTTHWENTGSTIRQATIPQRPWYARLVWFVLIGWWLGAIWLTIAYALCLLILTLPLGLMMIDRTPGVITLQRN